VADLKNLSLDGTGDKKMEANEIEQDNDKSGGPVELDDSDATVKNANFP